MKTVDWILDFVFPKRCVGCSKYETFLCEECKPKMMRVKQICPMCCGESIGGLTHKQCKRKLGMEGLKAVCAYRNPVVRAVVDGIKYGFNRDLVKIILSDYEYGFQKVDMIVPVPLHWYRENWRGFNQAEEIAMMIGKVEKALVRRRKTEQQARIKNKELRVKNIEGAFQVVGDVRDKRILLVDDVFTSGASMRECARVLKKAGAREVWGFVLAR